MCLSLVKTWNQWRILDQKKSTHQPINQTPHGFKNDQSPVLQNTLSEGSWITTGVVEDDVRIAKDELIFLTFKIE